MTTTAGANEKDSAPPSGTRRGPDSKARTISVKAAWREARKSLQRAPRPTTKRRSRTEEEFATAKKFNPVSRPRHRQRPAEVTAAASMDWWEWQNIWGWGEQFSDEIDCHHYTQPTPYLALHL